MTEIIEKILLLLAGGALAVLGAWINDQRSEKRRRQHNLESAYLTWLNSHPKVIGRLRLLADRASEDHESPESLDRLLDDFEAVLQELASLSSAVDAAFMYEARQEQKSTLEKHSTQIVTLAQTLGVIVSHHRFHQRYRNTLREADMMVSRADDLVSLAEKTLAAATGDQDLVVKAKLFHDQAVESRQQAVQSREEGREHLRTCTRKLSENARRVSKHIDEIEEQATGVRAIY